MEEGFGNTKVNCVAMSCGCACSRMATIVGLQETSEGGSGTKVEERRLR